MLQRSKIFLIFCLAFIIGIWLGKYVNLEIMAILAMIFIIATTLAWSHKPAKVVGFAGLIMVLAITRTYFDLQQNQLAVFYGRMVNLSGVVLQEPDERSDKTYLTLGKLSVEGYDVNDKILLTVPRFPEYEYGDRLKFSARLVEPSDAQSTGEFSYKNYLSRFGIEAVVYYPVIEKVGVGQGNLIKALVLKIKRQFVQKISEILPEPHNSFLAGLLVGLRRGIPDDLTEAFNATGTTHIIAISGFNITIIAQFIDWVLLRWFGRRISFVLSLACIALFVIMAGASASVVRAGIMGALGLIALNSGRINVITNALVLTAAVMVGLNPKILHFDVGFQLSFLALMGLVYLSPILAPHFLWLWKYIRQILVATLSAQIFVIPILLYNFDRLSLIAPFTNILVLPFIPLTMLFGFVGGLVALVSSTLAAPLLWMAWVLLEYVMQVVNFSAKLPLASVEYKNFHLAFLIVYYLGLSLTLLAYNYPQFKEKLFLWKPRLKQS